jgi:hypothetical protein
VFCAAFAMQHDTNSLVPNILLSFLDFSYMQLCSEDYHWCVRVTDSSSSTSLVGVSLKFAQVVAVVGSFRLTRILRVAVRHLPVPQSTFQAPA